MRKNNNQSEKESIGTLNKLLIILAVLLWIVVAYEIGLIAGKF